MPEYPGTGLPRVAALGACTPLGFSVAASFAAMRAGLVAFTDGPSMNSSGELIKTSAMPGIAVRSGLKERLEALALQALADLDVVECVERAGLFLGLPGISECTENEAGELLGVISRALELDTRTQLVKTRCHTQGRSAFFFALNDAINSIAAGDCDAAIVGAVDSLCCAPVLRRLDRESRLLGAVSSDGVIPGEAAAFAVLVPAHRSNTSARLPNVLCVALDRELHHFGHESPNTARALSSALRKIRTHSAVMQRRADLLFTCETGERYWTDELSMAYFRNVAMMPEPFMRTIAAESFGDLGAASGAVQFAMGIQALARPKLDGTPNDLLLMCGASDDGHLGACMVMR